MTDYEALAQRAVRAGIGQVKSMDVTGHLYYTIGDSFSLNAGQFVTDGRVILAAMTMVQERFGYDAWQPDPDDYDLPLGVAILKRCLDALEGE